MNIYITKDGLLSMEVLKEAKQNGIEISITTDIIIRRNCIYLTDTSYYKECENAGVPYILCVNEGESIPFDAKCPFIVENSKELELWYILQCYSRYNNEAFVVYEDDNYIVREMTIENLPQMYDMYGKAGVKEYVEPLYELKEETEFTLKYIENMYSFYGFGLWLAFNKANGDLVGRVGFSIREINERPCVELGYIIDSDYQGKGIGKYLCQKLINIGRNYWDFEDIYVCCHKENKRSIALAKALGFREYEAFEEFNILINQKDNG